VKGGKEVLPLTYCRNKDGKREWRWKSFDKPRPLYGLDRLAKNPGLQVCLVEGEKCTVAGAKKLKNAVVASWIGGSSGINCVDWSPLKGRKVLLWPDNDEAGLKAMIEIWRQIKDIAAAVKFVNIPDGFAKGWDIADAEMSGRQMQEFIKLNIINPEDAERNLRKIEASRKRKAKSPEQKSEKPSPDPEKKKKTGPFDKAPFRILGYNKGNFFYFPHQSGQVTELSPDRHNKNNFMTLAPLQWWEQAFMSEKGVSWTAAMNALVQTSFRIGVFDSQKIRGRGAWFDDNRIVLHLGNKLVVDNKQMEIQDLKTEYVYELAAPTEISYSEPLERKDANKLIDIFNLCPVSCGLDAKYLAGWCVIAPICGALKWRPHLWVTGRKGTGKSWIMNNIISPILGSASLEVLSKSSEAGIRQNLEQNAFPVLFDEAESENRKSVERMEMVLELMRGASSETGAVIIKGSSSGKSVMYRIRSCFCLGSVNVPIQFSADESRITVISLTPKHPDVRRATYELLEDDVNAVISKKWCASFRARSISMIPVIRANAEVFGKAIAEKLSNQRIGDQLGTLLAGAYTLYSDTEVTLDFAKKWVEEHNWDEAIQAESESDEKRCLFDILQAVVSIVEDNRRVDKSVIELIGEANEDDDDLLLGKNNPEDAHKALLRIGIRVREDAILISNSHAGVKDILKDTEFLRNWGRQLERIEGAVRVPTARFIGGIRTRAVMIPMKQVFHTEDEN